MNKSMANSINSTVASGQPNYQAQNSETPVLNQATIDTLYDYQSSRRTIKQKVTKCVKNQCDPSQLKLTFMSFLPILTWLPKYNWKIDSMRDVLGGITVGIISIPQGMSYAGLMRVPFVYGLYTNIVPTIGYFFVGSSMHGAVGTTTMASILLGHLRLKYVPDVHDHLTPACYHLMGNKTVNKSNLDPSIFDSPACFTTTQMVTSMALLGGIILIIMGICRLGACASYLSDCVVDAYTSGAAVIVITAQLDYLLGVHLAPHGGVGSMFLAYYELFSHIQQVNLPTLVISSITIVFLIIMKELVNPHFQRRFRVPIPGDMVALIVAIIVSTYCNFQKGYNVAVLGYVPAGLPAPRPVRFDIMPHLFFDTILVVIVAYSTSISLEKLMAKKHNYKIDPAQEFYALGLINIVGSFFQCFQSGLSVGRTIVYESTGAKTQIAGLIGTVVVMICVLWMTPYLYPLPQCVLGSIIVVACIQLLKNMHQLKTLWKVSKVDFAIFLSTFLAVIIFDVSIGLAISVLFAFLSVILRTQFQNIRPLGRLGESNVFGEVSRYGKAEEIPGVKIFQYRAPLHYASVDNFQAQLYDWCHIDPGGIPRTCEQCLPQVVIIDCSSIAYIDVMGVKVLKEVYNDMKKAGIGVYFAATNATMRRTMESAHLFDLIPKENFFTSVSDAVTEATMKKELNGHDSFDRNGYPERPIWSTFAAGDKKTTGF